jgi:hypothetical protein
MFDKTKEMLDSLILPEMAHKEILELMTESD